MGTKKDAQEKLRWLNSVINKAIESQSRLSIAETAFQFCYVHGSTKKYFMELLEHFTDRGLVRIEKGEIVPNEINLL